MATLGLGQNVSGSFTNSDPVLNGKYYDEYDLLNLDSFRQLTLTFNPGGTPSAPNTPSITTIELINSVTGGLIATELTSNNVVSIDETTFPGISYKVRVSNSSLSTLGNYTLSSIDGGKAKSIVSTNSYNTRGSFGPQVGTIGTSGKFFTLASGGNNLDDVAMAANGQIYGISSSAGDYSADRLSLVNPNLNQNSQVDYGANIKNTAGTNLYRSLRSLGFDNNGQLYSIGTTPTGTGEFYRIDPTTKIATLLATLPAGLSNSGDLVYDPTNQRFLATAPDTGISDALWQIPLANPASATKIGLIGSLSVHGLNFENGQLTGFTNPQSTIPTRISINPITGAGTISQSISGTPYVYGSATIVQNVRNDFNNDGKADILWRNNDGRVALWQMNGSTVTTGSTFATVSTDWKISSSDDFNGDRKADILWRNDNGQVALWTMDGATKTSGTVVATVGNDWKIAGTADFGGDSKADILWRNDNGQMAIWQMDGATQGASAIVANVDTAWKIAGTGDFGGDGKSDILWRKNDGSVALWQMDGTNILSQNFLNPYPTVDNSWKIAGTGDFNGDSKSDILWRNDNGSTNIWLMDGANVLSFGPVPQYPTVDNSWKIAGTGDFGSAFL